MKRYFKINTGFYGGEVVVGKSTEDFVSYWANAGQQGLTEHLERMNWGEDVVDVNSPTLTEDGDVPWPEVDDYEHLNGPYSDNEFVVCEIELADGVTYEEGSFLYPDDWEYEQLPYEAVSEDEHFFCSNHVYSREVYTYEKTDREENDYIPVFQFHLAGKGSFGEVVVETDGEDFDPEKLAIGIVETDLCEIIEAYWYDGVMLTINFEDSSSTAKGTYACVGYMNKKWYDSPSEFTPDSEQVQEELKSIYSMDEE